MTKYFPEYDGHIFIKPMEIKNTLGEVLSRHEFRQLHLAETEKFAHVTKFFNGDKQIVWDGEKDILIPSHKVATYDVDPEMSAQEIYDTCIAKADDFDFVLINFANGDMVGHTGNMQATITAIKKLDTLIGALIGFCDRHDFELLITADHGNSEDMGTPEHPITSHTMNPVPFRYISHQKVQALSRDQGELADIAPTVLTLMGIIIPPEMTGTSLVDKHT